MSPWSAAAQRSSQDGTPRAHQAEAGQVASKDGVMKTAAPAFTRVGPWIKGMVVDTSGQPVAGGQVSPHRTINPTAVTTKTDGTFVIATNETRLLNQAFLATADNGARQGIFRFDGPTGKKDPRIARSDRAQASACGNGLRRRWPRAPVEGAAVFLDDISFPVAQGRTDARGMATLAHPRMR